MDFEAFWPFLVDDCQKSIGAITMKLSVFHKIVSELIIFHFEAANAIRSTLTAKW